MKQQLLAAATALSVVGAAKSMTASAHDAAHSQGSLANQAMRLAVGAHLQTSKQFTQFFALVHEMSTCEDPAWHAPLCSEEFEFKDGSALEVLFVRVRDTYQLRPHACPHAPFAVAAPP